MLNLTEKCVKLVPNFAPPAIQTKFVQEIDQNFDRLINKNYIADHWDRAILNYRERELDLFLDPELNQYISQIDDLLLDFSKNSETDSHKIFPKSHFIDLKEGSGQIMPHIDGEKFTGPALASLSLISSSVLTLAKDKDRVEILLNPGDLWAKGQIFFAESCFDFWVF